MNRVSSAAAFVSDFIEFLFFLGGAVLIFLIYPLLLMGLGG
jgi:hypothetical protein